LKATVWLVSAENIHLASMNGFVQKTEDCTLALVVLQLRALCGYAAEHLIYPRVFPTHFRRSQRTANLRGKRFQLFHNVRPFWIEVRKPRLEVLNYRRTDARTILNRSNVAYLQEHTSQLSFEFSVRATDVTQPIGPNDAVIHPCVRNESDAAAP